MIGNAQLAVLRPRAAGAEPRAGGPAGDDSPLNSFVGSDARPRPGSTRLLPALYPTGRRNYLRVFPTDDLQGAALALLARDRGRERCSRSTTATPARASCWRPASHRRAPARAPGRRARDLGSAGDGYAALAERVGRRGAAGRIVGGLLDNNAARVVRDSAPAARARGRPAGIGRPDAAAAARPQAGAPHAACS